MEKANNARLYAVHVQPLVEVTVTHEYKFHIIMEVQKN